MIDFKELEKREPNKSPEEKEYDALCEQYEQKFGEKFGYSIVSSPPREVAIAELKQCLTTNTKQVMREHYEEGCVY